jgi:cysteinyl-tRNA synthetase
MSDSPLPFKRKRMNENPFETEEFYELMQRYRHSPMANQTIVMTAYQEVQTYCKKQLADALSTELQHQLLQKVIDDLKTSTDSLEQTLHALRSSTTK